VPHDSSLATPLKLPVWQSSLDAFPDRPLAQYILRGISQGFRIGVNQKMEQKPSRRNLKSAYEHPEVVSAYLQREVDLGRMLPLQPSPDLVPPSIQISPFGVIPKRYKPDKWRLITDLSSPEGNSVNDAISRELCSVCYTSVDTAAELIHTLGKGCLLAKLDLQEAYRAVAVHPSDQGLLAVSWRSTIYIDRALPFGLRSAPKIFSALTDTMMWMLHRRGIAFAIHYLDDFLVLGPAGQPTCQQALTTTISLCEELGFAIAPEKTEGPTTSLTFLGIEMDTVQGQLRLPQEKLTRLSSTIAQWMKGPYPTAPRSSGKKRELLSLIGLLNHAASVVRPGRAFLRNLIDAAASVSELDHWVHLNQRARADLAWWNTFLKVWNGTSVSPPPEPSWYIVSDASGSWGCGAFHGNRWFQPEEWAKNISIAPKELVPIVVATVLWGAHWAGGHVRFLCDNAAVVMAVNRGSARDPSLSHLFRILALVTAILGIHTTAKHLPGTQNTSADALSRNKLPLFFSLNPQASPVPAIVPQELRSLVFNTQLQWTSPSWVHLLSSSFITALRLPPAQLTDPPNAATRDSAINTESPLSTHYGRQHYAAM
jgi:hypothetical protein